jgi:hypothetical protein
MLASTEVGRRVHVRVTATNSQGTASERSWNSAVVAGPPPPASCTIADTSGCVPKTTLSFLDETWTCTQPLTSYGQLPLKVVIDFTNNQTSFGARLGSGCTGDADSNTIDLILDVRGNGKTFGTGDDSVRVMNASPGASNIQITGRADCGLKQGAAHQDGIHAIGGTNLTFVDFAIGNYDGGAATCQGAGGVVFFSGSGSVAPRNMRVIRGKYIGCNHGLLDGDGQQTLPTGSVVDAKFRTGRYEQATGLCIDPSDGQPYNISPPCITTNQQVTESNLTCQLWNRTTGQWEDQ